MSVLALPLGRIVRLADTHVANGGTPVALSGPEPTGHPAFLEVVEYLLRRNLPVIVPTEGSAGESILAGIDALPAGPLRFIVDAGPVPDPDRRLAFLRRQRKRCELRLGEAWTAAEVLSLVEDAGLREARIHVETLASASELVRMATALRARQIPVHLAPGVRIDAFTDAELGALYRCGAVLPR